MSLPIIDTPERAGRVVQFAVAAATDITAGALVARDANGYAVPASAAANLVVIGRAEDSAINSAGANGDVFVNVKRGVFRYKNSATSPLTAADIGTIALVEDMQTVAKVADPAVKAGRVVAIEDDSVWVDTYIQA